MFFDQHFLLLPATNHVTRAPSQVWLPRALNLPCRYPENDAYKTRALVNLEGHTPFEYHGLKFLQSLCLSLRIHRQYFLVLVKSFELFCLLLYLKFMKIHNVGILQ